MKTSLLPVCSLFVFIACASSDLPAVTIDMTPEAFSPATVGIKTGQQVCWVNHDAEGRWPASNIHPTHEIYPEFDPAKPMRSGETWCFTFRKPGIWKFHDHLFPELTGTVNVE